MDWFEDVLKRFVNEVRDDRIEIYNEFSLQHELGIAGVYSPRWVTIKKSLKYLRIDI